MASEPALTFSKMGFIVFEAVFLGVPAPEVYEKGGKSAGAVALSAVSSPNLKGFKNL